MSQLSSGGVGLGLALAHRIVVLHGGRIRLEDRPGGGTRALLSFPRDTIVTVGNRPDPGEPPAPEPATISVVSPEASEHQMPICGRPACTAAFSELTRSCILRSPLKVD